MALTKRNVKTVKTPILSALDVERFFGSIAFDTVTKQAHQMAAHESPRTTKLCDRRSETVSLDEVVRINLYVGV